MAEATGDMIAVRLHETGGPQSLRIDRIPIPEAGEGEVLVRLRAAALNHRDVFITQGLYPNIRMPVTLGSDGAGEVVAVNGDSSGLRAGEEVVIDPMLGWGDDPRVWESASSLLGMPRDGTFAQYVTIPAENVYRKPEQLSMEEAAAIPLAGLTAYRAIFTRGALARGETVLITGVGGGVQTFVLLFAKQAGARDRDLEQLRKTRAREGAWSRSRNQLCNDAELGQGRARGRADRSRR